MTRVHFNIMLVLQSCTDSLQVLPGSFFETFPMSSDGTYAIGNMKFDIDIEEEAEVNVKTEKVIGCEEEKCIDIKEEKCLYSEEEEEEGVDIQIKEDVRIKVQWNIL